MAGKRVSKAGLQVFTLQVTLNQIVGIRDALIDRVKRAKIAYRDNEGGLRDEFSADEVYGEDVDMVDILTRIIDQHKAIQ